MVKNTLIRLINKLGYNLVKADSVNGLEFQTDLRFVENYEKCKPFTMTSIERMYALHSALNYVISNGIKGDFVECGTWKGGSSMLMAKTLFDNAKFDVNLFLYDTFEGMSVPSSRDVSINGLEAADNWNTVKQDDKLFCFSEIDEVKANLLSTSYPIDRMHFIKGKVEDTIPQIIPEKIALLRLDTDWYESTYHEMKHLYPRLTKGGVLIIDDYGHWNGAREAVDQYFSENDIKPLLNRIDYTGRLMIKQD